MKTLSRIALFALIVASCQSTETAAPALSPWQGEIQRWGTLRETLRDGHVEARVAIADVAREGVWGIGALDGLRGEVTIADGEVWITEGNVDAPVTTHARTTEASATVLFAAEVSDWVELTVDEPVDPSVLDAFLASQARAAGLDPAKPFPFVVEGELTHLQVHVIAGECPIRARMMGEAMTSPAYEVHAPSISGRLVGIYAAGSSGILCHMGSSSHVHVIVEGEQALTGHAETVGLAAGSKLRIPRT